MSESIINNERISAVTFSDDEKARYARHLIMPEVTLEGQRRLKASRVLCIGAGGLGSPVALYLASAGVGALGLVDADRVDLSNLQRQILHGTADVGRPKLQSGRDRLFSTNPNVRIELHECRFEGANAVEMVSSYDLVIDGSDNFPTRYLSNDVCAFARKPNIYGSVFRFEGQVTVFAPHLGGPCYRCMFPQPPEAGTMPNCAEAGVLGVLPGIIGMMQAIEAIKLILGKGEPLIGRLLHFDALASKFREFRLRRDPECPVCGDKPTITEPIDYDAFCNSAKAPASPDKTFSISPQELKDKLHRREEVNLIDVREPFEHEIAQISGAKLIPLVELPGRFDEIQRDQKVVVFCHTGVRSARAVQLLREEGFPDVLNLEGGIEAWSHEVDPAVPRY